MSRNTPTNTDDIIDSRDIIARIDELQSERDALENDCDELKAALNAIDGEDSREYREAEEAYDTAYITLTEWDNSDEAEELRALTALADEGSNSSDDWTYGATLIRDGYFADYAEELCKDIGDLPQNIPDYIVIDWEATAENLKQDYTEVDFDGETYWVR